MTNFKKVEEFHKAFKLDQQKLSLTNLLKLRRNLIKEESEEVSVEFSNLLIDVACPDYEKLLKELVDLLYVVYGTAVSLNLDIDAAFNEVHRSNMSKLDDDGNPIFREDGKVLKSKNYVPANLKKITKEK